MKHRLSRHAAVDLGATSGRVVVADVTRDALELTEIHRFPNGPVERADGLHWDVTRLFTEAMSGLSAAGRLDSVAVDSWAIDYALLDTDGALLNEPWCYRDSRTDGVTLRMSAEQQFAAQRVAAAALHDDQPARRRPLPPVTQPPCCSFRT